MPNPQKKKVGGRPFQSKVEPFLDDIRTARKARKTWAEIAGMIQERGVDCTASGVFYFFKAAHKRDKLPLGFESLPGTSPQSLPNKSTFQSSPSESAPQSKKNALSKTRPDENTWPESE